MREIVLDTETTGLHPREGHRIVEIGGMELFNHMPTGRTYHQYINPERGMPTEAFEIHGISEEFLIGKPVFAQIAQEFLDFIGDARMVIHNASFDVMFLNAELGLVGLPQFPATAALDTLDIARKRFPGAQNSLDALCRRFSVDNSTREKHGALLDSEILAEVYLELIGGRQPDFALITGGRSTGADGGASDYTPPPRPRALPSRLSQAEAEAHTAFLAGLGAPALWGD